MAAIKNPPVVFARQANIAHGLQQVNNGAAPKRNQRSGPFPALHAREQSGNTSSELFGITDGERLDSGAQGAAGFANPRLATVGALNRPKVGRGARQGSAKQL